MPPKKQPAASKKGGKTAVAPVNSTFIPEDNLKQAQLQWPVISPVLPPSELELEQVLPGQIITIPRFFTQNLCKTYVNWLQKSVQMVTTPGKPQKGYAVRVNDRFQIHDATFAERLWQTSGLKEIVAREPVETWGGKEVLGLNPRIRIYRYSAGQFFDKHYDDTDQLNFGNPPVPARTTWTLLIYLTGVQDGIVGGETVFYTEATKTKKSEEVVVNLERGLAVLHKHGKDCMLHEGRLVEKDGGVGKWVLRSDLVIAR
ncbi:hypothetical protein BZA77DRAFT_256300 [Pyronema omphalodes]|nr:hypothetical protein BZA77DRAFT_256300 [Pyronema omphalodes]